LNSKDRALGQRGRRGHANRLSREASFTKEISAPQDGDDRFLPARGEDRQLHLALLNVKNRVRGTALREDGGFLSIVLGDSPPSLREVHPEIERRVFFSCHVSAPYLSGDFDTSYRSYESSSAPAVAAPSRRCRTTGATA